MVDSVEQAGFMVFPNLPPAIHIEQKSTQEILKGKEELGYEGISHSRRDPVGSSRNR
jgi:hypothetical protein